VSDELDLELLEWVIRSWEDGYGGELRIAKNDCGEFVLEGRYCGSPGELLRILTDIIREVLEDADL